MYCKYRIKNSKIIGNNSYSTINFNDVTTIGSYGLYRAFQSFTSITSVSFSSLTTIGDYGLYYAFTGCSGIPSIAFPNLTSISTYGLGYAFPGCSGITSVSFPKLTTIGGSGLSSAFQNCSGLTSVSFPKLTTISTNSFAWTNTSGAYYAAFYGCGNITAIHFRADAQSSVEAAYDYDKKFGASNATIYFDL